MQVVLYPNFRKINALPTALHVCDILHELNIDVFTDECYRNEFSTINVSFGKIPRLVEDCDIVIAIGGDGTILKASVYSSLYNKPLLGINTGHLGFMASMETNELQNLFKLKTKDYSIENRMMIDIKHQKSNGDTDVYTALNDVVISRLYSKITDFEIKTNGRIVNSLRADGVVFSTPTGSTAYALSAGGPILEPLTECIQVTPICPHSLFSRTMIFSADRTLELQHFTEASMSVYFSIDGLNGINIQKGEKLIISKSLKYLRLIDIKGNSFFDAVNNKLMNPIK